MFETNEFLGFLIWHMKFGCKYFHKMNIIFAEKEFLGFLTCSQGTILRFKKHLMMVTLQRLGMRRGSCAMCGAPRRLRTLLVTYMSWWCTTRIMFCCIFRLYNFGLQYLHELKPNKAKNAAATWPLTRKSWVRRMAKSYCTFVSVYFPWLHLSKHIQHSLDGGACEFVSVGLHGLSGSMQPSQASSSRRSGLLEPQLQQPRSWEQSLAQEPFWTGQLPSVTAVPRVLWMRASGSDSLLGFACTC